MTVQMSYPGDLNVQLLSAQRSKIDISSAGCHPENVADLTTARAGPTLLPLAVY